MGGNLWQPPLASSVDGEGELLRDISHTPTIVDVLDVVKSSS